MKGLNVRKLLLTLLVLGFAACASADLGLSGDYRLDLGVSPSAGKAVFNSALQGSVRLLRQAENWKFRSDLRAIAWYGSITNVTGRYTISLLDIFVRYSPGPLDVTLGKNYAAFGLLSVFNPFELDKSLNLTDLKYAKEGILLALLDLPFGSLSGLKVYVSPSSPLDRTAGGLEAFGHFLKFDTGIVCQRKGLDKNSCGAFLKGDLLLGVNAAWAYHFDDKGQARWNEASVGADYSFFEGRLIATGSLYYAEKRPGPGVDRFLTSRIYGLADLTFAADEFFSAAFDLFVNAHDGSCLAVGSGGFLISDGLSLTLLFSVPTGGMKDEFTSRRMGDFTVACRIEARL